jgi:hypothetical protein
MSIKSFVSSFFKKKENEIQKIDEAVINDKRFCDEICLICQGRIGLSRYKKVQGKYFHKNCFKREKNKYRDGIVNQ